MGRGGGEVLEETPTHGFSESVQINIFIDGLRPHSKQLLDVSVGGKIKLKTPKEAMELIENMAASDHVILRDRAYTPTKKSLLELTSQDVMLAQNKLLAKTLETLTATLSNLSQQLHAVQPPPAIHIGRCNICGGTHESDSCIVQDDASNEPPSQESSLRQETTKLEELLAQFMQRNESHQKSTDAAIKNLEVKIDQLAKLVAERPIETIGVNTEMKPKEECKAIFTRREEKEKKTKDYVHDEEGEKKEERERNEEKAQ
ncbi:hypothetical protein HKD37_11G031574 [Glycine soja]